METILTPAQVRKEIEAMPGDTQDDRVTAFAVQLGCSPQSAWRFMANGVSGRANISVRKRARKIRKKLLADLDAALI